MRRFFEGRGQHRPLRASLKVAIAWSAWCLPGLGALAAGAEDQPALPKPAGEIFVFGELEAGLDSLKGVISIDPEARTWRLITAEGNGGARVSPDGRYIAFSKYVGDDETEKGLWILDRQAGDRPVRVSGVRGGPHWLRDGRQLVVSGSQDPQDSERFETWRLESDGSDSVKLPIAETDLVLDCAPDGSWLLVNSNRNPPEGEERSFATRPVYAVRSDGTGEHLITKGGIVQWRHRFASDSRKLTYFQQEREECSLWVVNVDGSQRRLFLGERDDEAPFGAVWSPDGKQVAVLWFDRSRNEAGKKNDLIRGCHIEISDADGAHGRTISLPPSQGPLLLLDWRAKTIEGSQ